MTLRVKKDPTTKVVEPFFIHCKSNGISSLKVYIISHRLYQSFAMMRYDSNELMIYNFCEIDDIQDSVLI